MKWDCRYCTKAFNRKKDQLEHEDNDHSPRFNEDGSIHVSGGDQIILQLKKWNGSWKKYHKSHHKNTHESFITGGHRLESFEKNNGVIFLMKGDDVVSYTFNKLGRMKRDLVVQVDKLELAKDEYMKEYEKKHSNKASIIERIRIDSMTLPKWERRLMEIGG